MISLRMYEPARRVAPSLAAAFAELPVANISDMMARLTAGGSRLRPLHAGGVLCGPAFTVRTRPGDNLVVHRALDVARPGDVIVVDAGGDLTNALIGEMMLAMAEKSGVAGLVINGAVRDLAYIRARSYPVYAAGVTHRGPYKDGPGEMNVPVAIDGMVIEPGDLVVGDEDGLVCVPYDLAERVLEAAIRKHDGEERQMAAILAGSNDRQWVERALEKAAYEFVTSR